VSTVNTTAGGRGLAYELKDADRPRPTVVYTMKDLLSTLPAIAAVLYKCCAE